MVHSSLVQPQQITEEEVSVGYAEGPLILRKLASVWVHVNAFSIPTKVVVIDELSDHFILGRDAGKVFQPLMLKALRQPAKFEPPEGAQVKVTIGQTKYKRGTRARASQTH